MTPADLIQNDGLSAAILAQAVHSFTARDSHGMPLLISLSVLPLVLHAQTTDQVNKRRGDGALYRVVEETPRVSANLEPRVHSMLGQTFDALNLALASGSVIVDAETKRLVAGEELFPLDCGSPEVRVKLRAAARLGSWFAIVGVPQSFALLNLRM